MDRCKNITCSGFDLFDAARFIDRSIYYFIKDGRIVDLCLKDHEALIITREKQCAGAGKGNLFLLGTKIDIIKPARTGE